MAGQGVPLEPAFAFLSAAGAGPLQIGLDGLLVLLLLFGLGLLVIYQGFDEYRAGRLIRDTATETVRAAAVGRTELVGTARPAGTTLARPFTDGECLYASYQVREEREDDDGDASWATIDHDLWVTDFHLDDGTGAILVEPEVTTKFEISDEHSTTVTVREGASPPQGIGEFLEQATDVEPTSDNRRRYVEEVIPPGESVYVLGGAEMRPAEGGENEDRLVIRRDGGSDRFIVSDMTEEQLTGTLSKRAPAMILLGLAMSAFSLYFLLSGLGVG